MVLDIKDQYIVHLDLFEGPLDLLLHLVRVNEIDIYDIPIAKITHQYLEYINLMEKLNIEVEAEFLVIAATLMYLKSCELLPPPPEEIDEVEDLKAEFTRRLVEYQAFKNAAHTLEGKDKEKIGIYTAPSINTEKVFSSAEDEYMDVSLFDLLTAFRGALEKLSARRDLSLTHQRYIVEDKIKYIRQRLETTDRFKLSELFETCREKAEAITIFLAVLEMIKEKVIRCVQKALFKEIFIIKSEMGSSKSEENRKRKEKT